MALALLDGRIEIDQDLAQIVAACTTCGLCDVACKFIMAAERLDVIMALKEHLVERGQARFSIFCAACHGWDGSGMGEGEFRRFQG